MLVKNYFFDQNIMLVELINLANFDVKEKFNIPIKKYKFLIEGGDIFSEFDTDDQIELKFLYDSNTLFDLKKFIYLTHGIPIEYQYIECLIDDEYECIFYKIIPKDPNLRYMEYPINIREIQESNINGIQVDLNLVNNRDSYFIENASYSHIKSIDNIRVYDLRDALSESTLSFIEKDRDNYMTFYNGFVEKFFPMVILENFLKPHDWYPICSNLYDKISSMNDLSKKKSTLNPRVSINTIKTSYRHASRAKINILKVFNSLDLDSFDKIEAYISRKNKFLVKVLKNEFKPKLSEKHSKMSYIKLFIKNNYYIIYENNNIQANISENDSSKVKLMNIYKSELKMISNLVQGIEFDSAIQHFELDHIFYTAIYDIPPNVTNVKKIQSIFSIYESTEDYKLSQHINIKESLVLFTNRHRVISSDNEFEKIKHQLLVTKNTYNSSSNISITPQISEFKVEFNNIPLNQFDARLSFISTVLSDVVNLKLTDTNYSNSKIKILKKLDPVLFDNEKLMYSRICQSELQPSISSKNESGSVKYWNFSKGAPEYYKCDSKKYPHLKFITGQHPDGFCLPCCKKKSIENSTGYKDKHEDCLSKFSYIISDAKKGIMNKYILSYSCRVELDPGKLMKLSNTLQKFIMNEDCYILGIAPFKSSITNYTLTCISMLLYDSTDKQVDVILDIIDLLKKDSSIFYSLAEGSLVLYFTVDEFINFLVGLTELSAESYKWLDFINWEDLFGEIAGYFDIGITYLIEEDNGTLSDSQIYMIEAPRRKKHMTIIKRKEYIRYPLINTPTRMGNLLNIATEQIFSKEESNQSVASFANKNNQIFAQCFETNSGKILKTVGYFHASNVTNVSKYTIEEFVKIHDIKKPKINGKWINYNGILVGFAECMYFANFEENDYPVYDLSDISQPSDSEIKESIYFTNMYNLLLLHVNNKISKSYNKKIRNQIIKNPLSYKKLVSDLDFKKIKHRYNLYGNFDFLETERFEFDESIDIKIEDIVEIGTPNFSKDIDRSLSICAKTDYYCNGKKFILQNPAYLELLKEDLQNPYKLKYIQQYNEIIGIELYIKEYKNSKTIIYDGF